MVKNHEKLSNGTPMDCVKAARLIEQLEMHDNKEQDRQKLARNEEGWTLRQG